MPRLLFSSLAALATSVLVSAQPLLGSLRVENVDAPLAVSAAQPRFSWVVGAAQETYRIVAQDSNLGTTLWDSGTVESYQSSMVLWGAPAPPPPDTDISWTLSVTLSGVGVVSAAATFSTAPATPLPGLWIGGFDTLRASLYLDAAPVLRARLHVTGVGCYHAYVNGERVSTELSPGFGHAPNARTPYDTFDVAALLTPGGGENVVGVRLGSCKLGYVGQYCNDTATACNAAWAFLSVTQSGGNVTTLVSDGSAWRGANGPIVYQHLYNGEVYDARLEAPGWDRPGFSPATPWAPVLTPNKTGVLGPLRPAVARPVVRATSQAPVAVSAQPDGSFVFDFGVNMAGVCTLAVAAVSAPRGAVFTLYHGEVLYYAGGPVHNTYDYSPCVNRGGPPGSDVNCAKQNVTLIAAGGEDVRLTAHFSYAGFRYVQLFGWAAAGNAGPPPPGTLTCHFVHTDLPPSGGVSFGNASDPASATLNALQAAVVQTHLSNLVSVPTDCPQREKRGWTGDGQLTTHSAFLNFDMTALYEVWHQAMLDQQRIGCAVAGHDDGVTRPWNWACDASIPNVTGLQQQFGTISDVVPAEEVGMGMWPGDPSWEIAAIVVPHEMLLQGGDLPWLASNYDGPTAMLSFFNTLGAADAGAGGLITWSYLGDWIAIDTPSRYLVANFHYALGAILAADIAAALGHASDAAAFLALASRVSAAFPRAFWNATLGAWDNGSQSSQLLCAYLNLGGDNYTTPALAALTANVLANDMHLTVGATGARFLLQVLSAAGRSDLSLGLLLQDSYPSWAYEVLNASLPGTIWEAWDVADGNDGGGSDNHIFKAGGVSTYLYEGLLGLSFAMRPPPAAADAACAADEAALGLGAFSLAARFGLGCAEIRAAREVAAHSAALGGAEASLAEMRRAAAAALGPLAERPPALAPRFGFSVDPHAAHTLRRASGWRATAAGNVSFAWALSADGASLTADLTVPAGAPAGAALLELPLELVARGPSAPLRVVWSSAAGAELAAFVVTASGGVSHSGSGAAAELAPAVVSGACGGTGTAAAMVEGRRKPVSCAREGAVLLLQVPAGAHRVFLGSSSV